MAKFETLEEVEIFHQYVNRRTGDFCTIHSSKKNKDRYGEGYRILDARKNDNNNSTFKNICDTNIDGA